MIALVIDASIIANVTSVAESGAPIKSTIFPITFPINIDEEECAKDCEINCMAIRPGAKNVINSTPNTSDLSVPIAKDITTRNRIAVTIGPTMVCPKTLKNLSVSLQYKE